MKLDQNKDIKRLVIYFFYDKDGIVDRYIPYMLDDVVKNCSELVVVCNGKLTESGRDIFNHYADQLIVRENKGFDVWAYKTALDHYGWDKLVEYDEIIMMNHTIMGPLYPFSEMFAEMNERDLDFWGITKYHKHPSNPFNIVYGYTPEHIQSHFIAVRRSMIESYEYQKYWNERPEIRGYEDAVGKHEAVFTKYFADMGFKWTVYTDTSDMEGYVPYPLMDDPRKVILEKKCPIFKRKSFFLDYYSYLGISAGTQAKALMACLKENTAYDVGMVWENLLRTCHMADIKSCLNLNYILPKNYVQKHPAQKKVALVIHAYFQDLLDYCYAYALSMPEYSDIYITVGSEKMMELVQKRFSAGPWNEVKVVRIENRGRDVSALLVGVAEYMGQYDYVCFVHDKKVAQLDWGIKGYDFSERCFQNTLGSREFVNNVLALFEEEPHLGMLCPPPPNHADYFPTIGFAWGPSNFENTVDLAKKLGLNCPMSQDKEPVAPLGTMFWFRPKAMKRLLEYGWKYTDFPKEPNNTDGTLLHAVERIYPFVVQDAGFYCAWVLNDDYARTEWQNLHYMLRTINAELMKSYGCHSFYGMQDTIKRYRKTNGVRAAGAYIRFKCAVKRRMPPRVWNVLRKIYRTVVRKNKTEK